MVVGTLSIIGAIIAVVGAVAGGTMKAGLLAIGVLLFFAGFFITSISTIKIPPALIVFLLVTFIFWISLKKK